MDRLAELDEMQRRISCLVSSIREGVVRSVGEQPFHGRYLSDGREGRPLLVAMPFSKVCSGKDWCLSPEYYIPERQADAVSRYIGDVADPKELYLRIGRILKNGYVLFGDGTKDDRVMLNEDTMRIIRESDVGRHVTGLQEDPGGEGGNG